jgi:hypothetical protein
MPVADREFTESRGSGSGIRCGSGGRQRESDDCGELVAERRGAQASLSPLVAVRIGEEGLGDTK